MLSSLLALIISAPPEPSIHATVQQLVDDRWRVEYRLDEPTQALRFVRRPPFRPDQWTVNDPLRLERIDKADYIMADAPFDHLVLEFPSNTDWLNKDYEMVARFTEGGLIFYTGHLDLYPVAADGRGGWSATNGDEDDRPAIAYRFEPQPDQRVIIPGGGEQYVSTGSGVYVFFGDIAPITTDDVTLIVDQGLPANLRQRFDEYLPRVLDHYERNLGHGLDTRPTIYFTARPTKRRGYSTHGGVTANVVQLTVEADFENMPEDLESQLLHLIAHEAAHLWNGGQFHHRQISGTSWMHEGSADALAERSLHDLGYYDADDLADFASRQTTDCARGLTDGRLINAADKGQFGQMYACGALIALLTDRGWAEGDLFDFWERLFDQAGADGEYTITDYLALLQETGGRELAERVYRLSHEQLDDPFGHIVDSLAAVGIESQVAEGAASDDSAGSSRALSHLMGVDCKGYYSIYNEGAVLRMEGAPQCRTLKAETSYPVRAVAGIPVSKGIAVDAAIAKACAAGDALELTLESGELMTVPCSRPWLDERRRIVIDPWLGD